MHSLAQDGSQHHNDSGGTWSHLSQSVADPVLSLPSLHIPAIPLLAFIWPCRVDTTIFIRILPKLRVGTDHNARPPGQTLGQEG